MARVKVTVLKTNNVKCNGSFGTNVSVSITFLSTDLLGIWSWLIGSRHNQPCKSVNDGSQSLPYYAVSTSFERNLWKSLFKRRIM